MESLCLPSSPYMDSHECWLLSAPAGCWSLEIVIYLPWFFSSCSHNEQMVGVLRIVKVIRKLEVWQVPKLPFLQENWRVSVGVTDRNSGQPTSVFPQLLCTPKASAWPPPTCPASPRQRPSCAPRRACWDIAVPVGIRGLPMLGAGDLLPGGSRWSAKVVKHEKSSRSRGFMADLWGRVKVNEGHNSWTSGMKMLFHALVKHSLNSERGATKNYDTCLHLR